MILIGLTGGIASGKSTVSRFAQRAGALLVDADQLARDVVEVGQPAYQAIIEHFGSEILQADGTLNRQKLGEIIFHDAIARQNLNAIVHPAVRAAIAQAIADESEREERTGEERVLIIDIPLLYESGQTSLYREIWVAACDEAIQLARLIARDRVLSPEAIARIQSQMPLDEKIKLAHRVIDTNESLESVAEQVHTAIQDVRRLYSSLKKE